METRSRADRWMRSVRRILIGVAVPLIVLGQVAPARAGTQLARSRLSTSLDGLVFFNPCVLAGRGEDVELRGSAIGEFKATLTDGRTTRVTLSLDLSEVFGTGLVTGDAYVFDPANAVAKLVQDPEQSTLYFVDFENQKIRLENEDVRGVRIEGVAVGDLTGIAGVGEFGTATSLTLDGFTVTGCE